LFIDSAIKSGKKKSNRFVNRKVSCTIIERAQLASLG
jgi:hypothetical protein